MATTKKAKPAAVKRKTTAAKKPVAKKAVAAKPVRKSTKKAVAVSAESPTVNLLVYIFTALALLFLILATVKYS